MSNFNCDICGCPIIENNVGEYVTSCKHYPLEMLQKHNRDWSQVIFDNLYSFNKIQPL